MDASGFLNIDATTNPIDHNKSKGTFIIGAGFGRTGTSSLQLALNQLGWRSFHMREAVKNRDKMQLIIKAAEIKLQLRETIKCSENDWSKYVLNPDDFDWNQIFETDKDLYNACLDFPCCTFYLDLMKYYSPNYKVILTVRDDEHKWYESIKKTIAIGERMIRDRWLVGWLLHPVYEMVAKCTGDIIFDGNYDENNIWWDDEEYVKKIYNKWIESVKKNVPKNKLLIFNVKEGWKPLCDFLEIENIPNGPFPNSNSGQKVKAGLKYINLYGNFVNCVLVITFVIMVFMLIWYMI